MITTRLGFATAAAIFATALLGASPCFAEPPEPPITNPTSLVDHFDVDDITGMMRELGAQKVELNEAKDGKNKVVVFYDGQMPYNLGNALCDIRPGKCIALAMVVIVDGGTNTYSLESFNTFNGRNLFVTVAKMDGNKFGVGRLLILDGGVTRKNLAINIASFVLTFGEVTKFLKNQLVAGIQQNGAYQQANLGMTLPRVVRPSPEEISSMIKTMSAQYQTALRHR